MITRLPAWVWVGAAGLAMVAGLVNVVGYLGFEHQAVTHLTGTATLLGAAAVGAQWRSVAQLLAVIGAFLGGAILSGLIIRDSTLRLGRRYGVALGIEALLLLAAVPLFEQRPVAGAAVAAMACGLQNAMTATYSGTLVRTSHLTGMFSDLGMHLGQRLGGIPVPARRWALYCAVIGGFVAGSAAGAALFPWLGFRTLLVPAAFTGTIGIAYVAYRSWRGTGTLGE